MDSDKNRIRVAEVDVLSTITLIILGENCWNKLNVWNTRT